MLFLNGHDVEAVIDRKVLVQRMEDAMRLAETDQIVMPPRTYVECGDNSLALMPCFGNSGFSIKLVTIFPGNHGGSDPVVNGLVILNDIKTGAPRAILNGQIVTAIRTGAVGAVGVKHLACRSPHALGLVGAGVQGFEQILCAATIRPLTDVYVFDRDAHKIPEFLERLAQCLPNINLHQASTVEELMGTCRTIVLSTTSPQPVLPNTAQLLEGKCIIGTGSYLPAMQEIPQMAYELSGRMFIDTVHARHESGDVIKPLTEGWLVKDRIQTMGDFLLSREDETGMYEKTTIFKSVGMALFDLIAAEYIFERACAKGLGTTLNL